MVEVFVHSGEIILQRHSESFSEPEIEKTTLPMWVLNATESKGKPDCL